LVRHAEPAYRPAVLRDKAKTTHAACLGTALVPVVLSFTIMINCSEIISTHIGSFESGRLQFRMLLIKGIHNLE
jgi:hypothetical protein